MIIIYNKKKSFFKSSFFYPTWFLPLFFALYNLLSATSIIAGALSPSYGNVETPRLIVTFVSLSPASLNFLLATRSQIF